MAKIFVVSLHRCAGQSTELFLRNAGFTTCHWPAVVEGIDYQAKIIGLETARAKIVKILRPVFDAFDAVSDVPVPALYRELDKAYPNAQFIAVYRNPFDWVRSVRRHCEARPLDLYERVQYWRYLNTKPHRLEVISDDLLMRMYLRHYSRLNAHFNERGNFLLVDLNDPEIGQRLSAFLNIAPAEFPRFDYKDSATHRPENTLTLLQHRLSAVEAELARQERQAAEEAASLEATLKATESERARQERQATEQIASLEGTLKAAESERARQERQATEQIASLEGTLKAAESERARQERQATEQIASLEATLEAAESARARQERQATEQIASLEAMIEAAESARARQERQTAEQIASLEATLKATENEHARLERQAAEQIASLDATLKRVIREYADLTREMESAQRWLLEILDPELIRQRQVAAVPETWLADHDDAGAAHRAVIARLNAAADRANRLGLALYEQAALWRAKRAELRRAFEKAIIRHGRVRALEKMADPVRSRRAIAGNSRAEPLVSIVLPVYNQAYLVEEAIAGVVAQTYENWELIVVDDGSTDDLASQVQKHLGEPRVLFLRQPNQRLPAALNRGFAYARGDFLTWTSADNIMLPEQLEWLVEELTAHPEAGLVYSDYWAIDDKGEALNDPRWRSHNRDLEFPDLIRLPSQVTIENFHRTADNFIGGSFLYRREVADLVGPYTDDTFGGEDFDFWLRMHLVTEFHHVAEPLYKYRVHANTLTSRAAELGLFANIEELIEADRWRIETLLADGTLHSAGSLLRPVGQFHTAILNRCRPIAYRDLVEQAADAMPDTPAVVDIDVPLRSIDLAALRHADVLLCRSELTAAWLRREEGVRDKRILCWSGELTPAVQHAFIQAFADRVTAPVTMPVHHTPARIDDPFQPSRILLVVERWSSGGLENVVVDLADSLAASGRAVIVASADGAPPPAAAFATPRMRTLSFRGNESAFDAFLRREAIDLVNYHHSRFAVEYARRQAVATVYTMHNCYLWMDDGARAEVAVGLAKMDRLIAVSRQVAQFAVAQYDFPIERIVVVPNGLRDDIARSAVTAARPLAGGSAPFTVAMVGSFNRLKLQHVAIAGFAAVAGDIPPMRLRLIGALSDQPYAEELRAQIAASPHGDRIELVVGLSRAETVAALAEAHVFLLPSLVEGCSMALLEAAAAGCVSIVSDVGSARDMAACGTSVALLPSPLGELESVTQQQFFEAAAAELPKHEAHVAAALRNVWIDYASLAAASAEARVRVLEACGMQRMTDAYLLAYAMACRGGPPSRPAELPDAAPPDAEAGVLAAVPG